MVRFKTKQEKRAFSLGCKVGARNQKKSCSKKANSSCLSSKKRSSTKKKSVGKSLSEVWSNIGDYEYPYCR